MERWPILAVLGTGLLVLASTAIYAEGSWDIENNYSVWITAPPEIRWTLWLPKPETPIPLTAQGSVDVLDEVDTIHGPYLNVTATGNVTLEGTAHRSAFDLLPREPVTACADLSACTDFSGYEASAGPSGAFWLWRWSSNESATISVTGHGSWSASHLGGDVSCGGWNYEGQPAEGWSLLPQLGTDCVQGISEPLPWIVAGVLGGGGAAVLIVALRERRHRGARPGKQVFLPPPA